MDFVFVLLINVVRIYKFAIIARILLSWIQPYPRSRLSVLLFQATEPVLRIFRGLIPPIGMIDISPLIAFFALDFAQMGLMSLMNGL
ncbi:YggT family protein [Patescibacteria group bacterium]|nr:YggT family protein [Patescibacteria group bacterium]MBU1954298.1 YggT family protein [Patescibacteria group bacterium]